MRANDGTHGEQMPRESKGPWLRAGRGWFVQHHGRQVKLAGVDADEKTAKIRWGRLQDGKPLDDEPEARPSGPTFVEVSDAYLEWLAGERTKRHVESTRWRLLKLCKTDVRSAVERTKYP